MATIREAEARVQSEQTYGQRVRLARQAAGLTLRALAECAGCDFTTISHIEHDRLVPSFDLAEALGMACGVELMPPSRLPFARLLYAAEDVYHSHYSYYGTGIVPGSPLAELGEALRALGRVV